jgi:hypothetical protein
VIQVTRHWTATVSFQSKLNILSLFSYYPIYHAHIFLLTSSSRYFLQFFISSTRCVWLADFVLVPSTGCTHASLYLYFEYISISFFFVTKSEFGGVVIFQPITWVAQFFNHQVFFLLNKYQNSIHSILFNFVDPSTFHKSIISATSVLMKLDF